MSFISSGKAIFSGLGVVCGVVSVFACKKNDIVCWCFFYRCVTVYPKGGPGSPVRLCWGRVFQSQRSFLVGNSSALVFEDVGDYEVVGQATDKTFNVFQKKVRQNVGKRCFHVLLRQFKTPVASENLCSQYSQRAPPSFPLKGPAKVFKVSSFVFYISHSASNDKKASPVTIIVLLTRPPKPA